MRYRNFLTVVAALGILAAGSSSARADSTVAFDFWYVISAAESTDPSYTAAFGSLNIVGRLNGGLVFNGADRTGNAKFANLKFYQPSAPNDPSVSSCARKALAVATTQVQFIPSSAANAQLVVKVTGDVRLNEGNGGYDGGQNLTIIEVRSLKSMACEVSLYIPNWP
jgi:hypothetical protein